MTEPRSLDAAYFDGIFAHDDDPWDLASSAYEQAKFARSIAALDDRRYARALEVGCAHGVLTARLHGLCDDLLAIDISAQALARARPKVGGLPRLELRQMAFPGDHPAGSFDLIVLSEVAYYWDGQDLARAARWMCDSIMPGGRALLVHYTGPTDYPSSGDEAVDILALQTRHVFAATITERHPRYRLDLWERR